MSIGIYKFQNNITKEIYIGQSVSIESRYNQHKRNWINGSTDFYKAIQQYGWNNFSYEVIEKCDISLLNEREKYWIAYYDSYKNGYNMDEGGSRPHSVDYNLIYDLYNKSYKPKEIAKEMQIGLSTVYQALLGYSSYKPSCQKDSISIYQYSLSGEYIAKWKSCKEASKALNIDAASIGKVLNGKRKSAGGFQWKKEYKPNINQIVKISIPRAVYQYDLNNKYIKTFDSISQAANEVQGDRSAIGHAAAEGLIRSAYGFRWSFEYII